MSAGIPGRSPRSRARRIGLVVMWLVIGVFVLRAGLDWWTGRQLAREVAGLEARYGAITPARSAAVSTGENRARVLRAAISLMNDVDWKGLAEIWKPAPTVRVPDRVRAMVAQNEAALRLADEARQRPKSDWSYERGEDVPPLLANRNLSNLLYLKAYIALEDGHADDSARALAAGFGIAASLRSEPPTVAQLIRIAIGLQQYVGVLRLLALAEPAEPALADLVRAMNEDREPAPAKIALISEMRWGHERLTALADGDAQFFDPSRFDWFGDGKPSLWRGLAVRFCRPAVQFVHARFLREIDQLIAAQATLRGNRVLPSSTIGKTWVTYVDRWLIPLERALDSGDEHAAMQSAAVTAIALRRYRLARGAYPADLGVLVPEYLAALPLDPYTGKPVAYVRVGAGFELKAGTPAISNYEKRPFVWTIPR